MGIDDSRTPIVTAPVDLILSKVGLAANILNEVLAKLAAQNPNKIIFFMFINPSK
jgi:hypothetical protein